MFLGVPPVDAGRPRRGHASRMSEPGHPEPTTERVGEADALAYEEALLHFIETHDDLKEVGRATDLLRKLRRGRRELEPWELELARHARVELEAE
jgi:hypothetical protein